MWVFNNIWKKWTNIVRSHLAQRHTKDPPTIAEMLQTQFSGYGTTPIMSVRVCEELNIKDTADIQNWTEDHIHKIVDTFLLVRFPTVLVLNKADLSDDTEKNIEKIYEKFPYYQCVITSALTECYLNRVRKQKKIKYLPGDSTFITLEDDSSVYLIYIIIYLIVKISWFRQCNKNNFKQN